MTRLAALAAAVVAAAALGFTVRSSLGAPDPTAAPASEAPPPAAAEPPPPPAAEPPPPPAPRFERIGWRESRALGRPDAGRLVDGVRFPSEGAVFFTWDPVLKQAPNRAWRRWGTDRLVRTTLRVLREFAAAHPEAPRVGIGDLSRPHGGDFGRRFGPLGHASHQNGLDVDVYYPRLDRLERAPRTAAQVDRRLAQDLVNRFVAAGAIRVFVGPNVGLTGPRGIVMPLAQHDNHLHVRLPPDPS
jgi:murein endopeptidase